MARAVADSDIVISTAAIPGQPAPKLITADAVASMRRGSVIVDLAAERGGNCALTEPGKTIVRHHVKIIGHTNLPATAPFHASSMYANNLVKLLALLVNAEGQLNLNRQDEVIAGCLVTHDGQVVHPRIKQLLGSSAPARQELACAAKGE